MKMRIIALLARLLAVLPMTSAWAGGSSIAPYWYAQAKAVHGSGCAKVYASTGGPWGMALDRLREYAKGKEGVK